MTARHRICQTRGLDGDAMAAVPRKRFRRHAGRLDGRPLAYVLADQEVRLRQVTRLREPGRQTPVLTSRRDLPALEVAYRMFEHWRQENFFK